MHDDGDDNEDKKRLPLRSYLRAGLQPIPLCAPKGDTCASAAHNINGPCTSPGKRPLLSGYPEFASKRLSEEETLRVFQAHGPCNIGIVVPVGHVVVEADSPDAEEELSQLLGETVTVTRSPRPGRGRALLFRLPAGLKVKNAIHRGASGHIDFLGPGGNFAVPPSVHKTLHVYTWAAGMSPQDIQPAELPPPLVHLLPKKNEQPTAPRSVSKVSTGPAISFLLKADSELKALWEGRGKTVGDSSESGYDFAIASRLVKAGYSKQAIVDALAQRPRNSQRDASYFERTADASLKRRNSK